MESYEALARFYDELINVDYSTWVRFIRRELESHGIFPGDRLLDLACGTATISVELARAGYNVTGLDGSEAMLAVARKKAARSGVSLHLQRGDLREPGQMPNGQYDAITCLCDSVNYLLDTEEVRGLFKACYQRLRPGGLLVFDVNSWYKLAGVYGDNVYAGKEDGYAYIWENSFDPASGTCQMNFSLFVQEEDKRYQRFDERHRERAYEPEELRQWLIEGGFFVERVYPGYRADELSVDREEVERWVFVVLRP